MKILKTVIFTSILFLTLFTLNALRFPLSANAQALQPQQVVNPYAVPDTNPDVPKNLHTLSQSIFLDMMSFVICQLIGSDPLSHNQSCLGFDPVTKKIGYSPNTTGGLIGLANNGIAMLYTPPLHSGDFLQYLSHNFQSPLTGKHVYAADQGVGITGLQPLLKLWVASRNVAYALLVLVFILTGLFIMLRIKIDPRTVLSIQNQLPKLIIGILLITFSFAIVGLLIDGMYVVMFIFLGLIGNAIGDPSIANIANFSDPLAAANKLNGGVAVGGFMAIPFYMGYVVRNLVNHSLAGVPFLGGLNAFMSFINIPSVLCAIPVIKDLLPAAYKTAYCGDAVGIFGTIAQPIGFIVVLLILVVALFKLWFSLIKAYLTILFNVVLGPLMILFGLLPGIPGGFNDWMKTIIANLLVFPAVAIFLAFGSAFAKLMSTQDAFAPPLTGVGPGGIDPVTLSIVPGAPGAFAGPTHTITGAGALLMLAAYLMAPGIADEINKLFKSEQGLTKGLGAGFAPALGIAQTAYKSGANQLFREPDPVRGTAGGLIYKVFPAAGTGIRANIGKAILRFKGYNLDNPSVKDMFAGMQPIAHQQQGGGTK